MPRPAKKVTVPAQLDRIVRRIVRRFDPERVILFGSHARGEAGPDSDIDLLVVLPVRGSKLDAVLAVRRAAGDSRVPLDVAVSTPEEFAWRKDVVGTIEWPATKEGKVLYARARGRRHGHPRVARQGGQ
jgi:predicted nucleotidyltransferase